MLFLIVCCVVLIIGIICFSLGHDSNFPPGPRGLPILGNIVDLLILLKKTGFFAGVFSELAEIYGPIVGLRLGPMNTFIVVSGREAVSEMLRHREFDGRPDSFSYRFRTMGERRGIIFNDGRVCENNRRFALKHLKELGFGKKTMEDIILENALSLIQTIEKKAKDGLIEDFTHMSSIAILNNTWSFIAGSKFSEEDSKVRDVLEMLNNNTKQSSLTWFCLDYLPFLRYIIPGYSGYSEFIERHSRIWIYFLDEILKHKITRIDGVSRDLIDSYLGEIDKQKNEYTSLLNEEELVALMKDFFAAGVETTNNSFGFIILYITIRKDVQKKLHQEIDEVIGKDSLPSLVFKGYHTRMQLLLKF
ncbi:methyl farnesoate epoxidase-like isoform X2 [Belonocnema kinseyi]|uniref:methyl farnesoate epoxidase-like isoform X2 n=1 Tax=Belonocnema kinseyi TaxID=2817044 RepID=UPI00143E0BAC|nr:methyl farnesoate epoxidase-like isoform X2 [Belonocnema kinseyi]XP_033223070.1 methyl farnesoate epoxidase-like isoform X2 [Belonocnema kinseyi]